MITSINGFTLDTDIGLYDHSVALFSDMSYAFDATQGRRRMFKGEEFYWAADQVFLGRECPQAMLATINGKIYKISYRFSDTQVTECKAIRDKAVDFIVGALGEHPEIVIVDSDHKSLIWQTNCGNVVLDADCLETEIILTSNSVKNATKISLFGRLFGKTGT